ncbi:hypothetical protein MBANPS3_009209 [Mucor bainieri]
MIPAALAILIYQVLAILGAEAVSQIVTSIAYRRRDLDYKLMYLQSPLDLILDYKRFSQTSTRKLSIVLLTCLTFVLKFIPTIMTKLNSSASIYYDTTATPLDQTEAISIYNWPSAMPVFDNFVPYLANPNAYSLQDILRTYIKEKLNQNVTNNNDGYWFTPNTAKRFEWDDQQVAFDPAFYSPPVEASAVRLLGRPNVNYTAYAFSRGGKRNELFTTSECNPSNPSNELTNFTKIHETAIKAAIYVVKDCIPLYDRSLVISTVFHGKNYTATKDSSLNANDTLYRLPKFSQGITASSSFGVSIFNHNSSHMTLGIKKTAHITLYTHGKNATLPADCTSADRPDISNNFVDLPYDAILCRLVDIAYTDPNNPLFVQAASRVYVDNYVIDVLYSHRKDMDKMIRENQMMRDRLLNISDVLMVDYTLFQAFNVEGNLKDNQEHMVAFSTNSLNYDTASDIETATDFTNDKIGTLLKALDPSRIEQATVDILVGMASMRVRWANGDYSDIQLNKAQVMDGIQTPTWWIIAVCAMALIFLLPQISRLVVRRIPEYADNLRNLLLLTIERSSAFEGSDSKAKNVGLLLKSNGNEEGRTALLSVNGHPVTIKKGLTSLGGSSTDERSPMRLRLFSNK